MQIAPSPVYGENNVTILYKVVDLLWRPVGILIRFVLVVHPIRGRIILMTTDIKLSPLEIIRIYGYRFKIEVSFKQALHILGAYAYHFWMKVVDPIRKKIGNQYLHRENEDYRQAVRRKIAAYHNHIQIGLIAQGLLQYLSICFPKLVWSYFTSWYRTFSAIDMPSERIVTCALKNTFPEFLVVSIKNTILEKFLLKRIDLCKIKGVRLLA